MYKFISSDELEEKFKTISPNMAVTKGEFECKVEGTLDDMEWNHMDQMHRPFIHQTYQEAMRIALGKDFAISLTRWGRWPLFIVVSDVRLKPGLYYQCMTIAGLFNVHFVITMTEESGMVTSKLQWYITSHKWIRFAHKILSRRFYQLNIRLQSEDAQIRTQRHALRQLGYSFHSSPPDYLSSNTKTQNTIYPLLEENACFDLDNVFDQVVVKRVGKVEFLVRRNLAGACDIWPAACPHEGGELSKGSFCEAHVACPWHGLKFKAVTLSISSPVGARYGFEYRLDGNQIFVSNQKKNISFLSEPCLASG